MNQHADRVVQTAGTLDVSFNLINIGERQGESSSGISNYCFGGSFCMRTSNYQHHNRLVDERLYQGWQIELQEFIRAKQIGLFWDTDMKRFFRTEFRQAVERMISLGEAGSRTQR
ncbi:MAG: hypothetical protein ACREOG_11890 [Gemmatimonadaceae bacterium]